MQLILGVEDWETTRYLTSDDLLRRLLRNFPSMVIDGPKGDAQVQEGLDRLIQVGAPEIILESHKWYFGKTIFVSIAEKHWRGAVASSYLTPIRPPLGDTVYFDVTGADSVTLESIARELEIALGMVVCPQAS